MSPCVCLCAGGTSHGRKSWPGYKTIPSFHPVKSGSVVEGRAGRRSSCACDGRRAPGLRPSRRVKKERYTRVCEGNGKLLVLKQPARKKKKRSVFVVQLVSFGIRWRADVIRSRS